MKLLCTLFSLGLAVMPAVASNASDVAQNRAEEIGKTYRIYGPMNGQVYRDATVTKITDAGVTIRHAEGIARLDFDSLSPKQREKFGITREVAEAIYAKEEQAQAAYEAQVAAKQKEWQAERQKAHEALVAKQTAARLEAERLRAERLKARKAAEPEEKASIVSVLEVPTFPIIRDYDNEILRPIQASSRSYRSRHYSSSYSHPVRYRSYGGSYGYPVRYGGSYGTHCYPGRGAYHHGHHRGSYGWINYRGSKFNVGLRW